MNVMPDEDELDLPGRTYSSTIAGSASERVVAAEGALEVGELDHRHRRVRVAEHVQLLRNAAGRAFARRTCGAPADPCSSVPRRRRSRRRGSSGCDPTAERSVRSRRGRSSPSRSSLDRALAATIAERRPRSAAGDERLTPAAAAPSALSTGVRSTLTLRASKLMPGSGRPESVASVEPAARVRDRHDSARGGTMTRAAEVGGRAGAAARGGSRSRSRRRTRCWSRSRRRASAAPTCTSTAGTSGRRAGSSRR